MVKAGEQDVTPEMITVLHGLDDQWVNNYRVNEEGQLRFHTGRGPDARKPGASRLVNLNTANQDPAADVAKPVEQKMQNEKLRQALRQIKPHQQELVAEICFSGKSKAEIARERGVNRASITRQMEVIYGVLKKIV